MLSRENIETTWCGVIRPVGNLSVLLVTVAMTSLLLHRHLTLLREVSSVTSRTPVTARLT